MGLLGGKPAQSLGEFGDVRDMAHHERGVRVDAAPLKRIVCSAADCGRQPLVTPGRDREPSEGAELLSWLRANEQAWRT